MGEAAGSGDKYLPTYILTDRLTTPPSSITEWTPPTSTLCLALQAAARTAPGSACRYAPPQRPAARRMCSAGRACAACSSAAAARLRAGAAAGGGMGDGKKHTIFSRGLGAPRPSGPLRSFPLPTAAHSSRAARDAASASGSQPRMAALPLSAQPGSRESTHRRSPRARCSSWAAPASAARRQAGWALAGAGAAASAAAVASRQAAWEREPAWERELAWGPLAAPRLQPPGAPGRGGLQGAIKEEHRQPCAFRPGGFHEGSRARQLLTLGQLGLRLAGRALEGRGWRCRLLITFLPLPASLP